MFVVLLIAGVVGFLLLFNDEAKGSEISNKNDDLDLALFESQMEKVRKQCSGLSGVLLVSC